MALRSVERGPSPLYYEIDGKNPDDVVVFIHGNPLDGRSWHNQVEALRDDYTTITYDVRGFGASDVPGHPYSHSDDLRLLLNALSVDSAHIAGHSMGGGIAQEFALANPERTRSLTLIDSLIPGLPSDINWNFRVREATIEGAKANALRHPAFLTAIQNPQSSSLLREMVNDYSGWHWTHHDPRLRTPRPSLEQLGSITVPSLVVVGEQDLDYFQHAATILHERIPNSRLVTIRQAGHIAILEQPDQVNVALGSFLADVR